MFTYRLKSGSYNFPAEIAKTYIEPVDLSFVLSLPKFDPLNPDDVRPKKQGIYFVVVGYEEVIYLGKTIDFRQRWERDHHRFYMAKFSYLFFMEIPFKLKRYLHGIEKVLLNKFDLIFIYW